MIDYNGYMQSDAWKEKRHERMIIDNHTCQCCGSHGTQTNELQVHHFNYKNIGEENVERDLVTLCKNCHTDLHRIMNRITGYDADGTPIHGWHDSLIFARKDGNGDD